MSMDFIQDLPKSQMKDVVLVVEERFTKFVHFVALSHPYNASKVAALYMQNVFKQHGMPTSIFNDRDPIFTSYFWQELMKLQGIQLAMSSAYHPQIDGQTEVVNRSLERYLRAFATDKPASWVEWLPLAEFWFNTNFHTSLKLTTFEVLYGYPPPRLMDYVPGTTKVDSVDAHLKSRQQLTSFLRHNLVAAQEIMKLYFDKHIAERSFAVGDQVFLRLEAYKQKSLKHHQVKKLSPKYYGPFQLLQRVGEELYNWIYPQILSSTLLSMFLA